MYENKSGNQKQFEESVKPLIKYLNDNHNPHTSVIVTPMGAEVLVGEIAFRTDEFLKD